MCTHLVHVHVHVVFTCTCACFAFGKLEWIDPHTAQRCVGTSDYDTRPFLAEANIEIYQVKYIQLDAGLRSLKMLCQLDAGFRSLKMLRP